MASWVDTWQQKAANFKKHLNEGIAKTRLADILNEKWDDDIGKQIALVHTFKNVRLLIETLPVREEDPKTYDEKLLHLAVSFARQYGYADVVTQIQEDTDEEWRYKTVRYIIFFIKMLEQH